MENLTAEQIFEKHPLPWTAHSLMIKDANGRQVIHLGACWSEHGSKPEDPYYLAGLNILLSDLANRLADRAPRFQRPQTASATPERLRINHERAGWSWSFLDKEYQRPIALAGHEHDILLLTDDNAGEAVIHIDDDHQTLLAHAYMVPHECDLRDCPGNLILQRLDALTAAENLTLDHLDDLDVTATKSEILKILISEFEYWKHIDSAFSLGAVGAVSNCIAAITSSHRAPWHPRKEIQPPQPYTPAETLLRDIQKTLLGPDGPNGRNLFALPIELEDRLRKLMTK